MAFPTDASVVVLLGSWWDESTRAGMDATITATPVPAAGSNSPANATPNLTDIANYGWIKSRKWTTKPLASGLYALPLIANDDPDLSAFGGYQIQAEGETPFLVNVSVTASTMQATQQVVDAVVQASSMSTASYAVTLGQTIQVVRMTEAAVLSEPAPQPPSAFLNEAQINSRIATAVAGVGGGGSSTLSGLTDVNSAGAGTGSVSALRKKNDGTFELSPAAPFGDVGYRVFLPGARFVATGDSITAANNDTSAASWADGWPTHLALASGGAIRMTWNAAHGGYTSTQLDALFDTEVLAQNPTLVGILPGRNDTLDGNGYPAETATFVKSAVAKCRARGIPVFLINQPPQGTAAISAPATGAVTPAATGGTLTAATYRYKVSAVNGAGETLPGAEFTAVVASGTTNSVRVTWGHVEGATAYKLYKETSPGSGTFGLIATKTTNGQSFAAKYHLDTGSTAPAAAPPGSNTTAVAVVTGATGHGKIAAINNWLSAYCAANQIPLVDVYEDLADPATGMYRTGYTQDGTHPTTTRQKYMGRKAWATLSKLVKPLPSPTARSNVDPRNLMPNGLLVNGSSSMPTGWGTYFGDGNFTDTLAARTGFAGKALTAALTAPDVRLHDSPGITTGFSVGDRIQVSFRLQVEGCEAGGANVQSFVYCLGPNARVTGLILSAADIDPSVWVTEFVVPASTTGFYLQSPYIANGTGQASIGEVTFVNLTTGQLLTP